MPRMFTKPKKAKEQLMEWDEDAYLARRAAAEHRILESEQHADDCDFEEADDAD